MEHPRISLDISDETRHDGRSDGKHIGKDDVIGDGLD